MGWCEKKRPPSHTYPDHQPSFVNFLHLLWSMASLLFNICQSFPQPLSKSSLVYLLVWNPLLHAPYMSSPNHLFFATHAYIIAACFAVALRLSSVPNLFSAHYLEICFYLNATSVWLFSSLLAEVPPHFISSYRPGLTSMQHRFTHNCCTTFIS